MGNFSVSKQVVQDRDLKSSCFPFYFPKKSRNKTLISSTMCENVSKNKETSLISKFQSENIDQKQFFCSKIDILKTKNKEISQTNQNFKENHKICESQINNNSYLQFVQLNSKVNQLLPPINLKNKENVKMEQIKNQFSGTKENIQLNLCELELLNICSEKQELTKDSRFDFKHEKNGLNYPRSQRKSVFPKISNLFIHKIVKKNTNSENLIEKPRSKRELLLESLGMEACCKKQDLNYNCNTDFYSMGTGKNESRLKSLSKYSNFFKSKKIAPVDSKTNKRIDYGHFKRKIGKKSTKSCLFEFDFREYSEFYLLIN